MRNQHSELFYGMTA